METAAPLWSAHQVGEPDQELICWHDMRVVHGGRLTESFSVWTGVRQGCLLSILLCLLAIDWVMKASTALRRDGIQCMDVLEQLDDPDFSKVQVMFWLYSHVGVN